MFEEKKNHWEIVALTQTLNRRIVIFLDKKTKQASILTHICKGKWDDEGQRLSVTEW